MISKLTANNRRNAIISLIEEIGLWNINKSELARKYGVSHTSINNDIKHIIKNHEVLPLKRSTVNIELAYKKAMMDCQKEIFKATGKAKQEWIKTMLQTAETITNHLERFGIKPLAKIDTDQIITVKWGEDEGDNPKD